MSLFTDKVIKYTPRLMKDLGITRVQACGVWGNTGTETGGFRHLQELNPTVAGSKGGYGWMQWTGPRRRAYEAWCKKNNLNPSDDESNYKYLVYETLNIETKSLIQLRKTTTVEAATETFMLLNLRPGVKHLSDRIRWARQAYEATKTLPGAGSATTGAVVPAVVATVAFWENPHFWAIVIPVTVVGALIGYLAYRNSKKELKNATENKDPVQ